VNDSFIQVIMLVGSIEKGRFWCPFSYVFF